MIGGLFVDGIIILNKPKGCTSNDVVNKVKKLLDCKVGHTGTLDPNATGVLPLLLGKGTKFSKYLINHDKKYCATLKLGIKTSTADVEGEIIDEKSVNPAVFNEDFLKKILNGFVGEMTQQPPMYSAIKVNGKKLYEYARNGVEVEIPKRKIEIYSAELSGYSCEDNIIVFNVECSKGTYIRSLCEDIAEKLGTVGYMMELERLKVGNFELCDSVTLEDLQQNACDNIWLNNNIITLESLLMNCDKAYIKKENIEKFYNGVKIFVDKPDQLCSVYCDGEFIGSAMVKNGYMKRDIIV